VVLGGTPTEGGLFEAGKILEKIRKLELKIASGETLSASIGLACRVPGASSDCANERTLVALADAALYKAKTSGRNRIETK
jgi:diguanylate cyclase (GGDEF)-like protein